MWPNLSHLLHWTLDKFFLLLLNVGVGFSGFHLEGLPFPFPFLTICKCCMLPFFLSLNSSSRNYSWFFLSAKVQGFIKWREFLSATNASNECLLRYGDTTKGHQHKISIRFDFSCRKKMISYLRDHHEVTHYRF